MSSAGIEELEPKMEALSPALALLPRALSRSVQSEYKTSCRSRSAVPLTINSGLNGLLDGPLEDAAVSPNINHSTDALLDIMRCAFVGDSDSLGDGRRKRDKEFLLTTGLALLRDFCKSMSVRISRIHGGPVCFRLTVCEVDEAQAFVT